MDLRHPNFRRGLTALGRGSPEGGTSHPVISKSLKPKFAIAGLICRKEERNRKR